MKDKNVAAVLALFFGSLGAHKFYLGQIGAGLVYLLFSWTMIPTFLSCIEFILLLLMDPAEFNRRFNRRTLEGGPVVVNMLPPGYAPVSWSPAAAQGPGLSGRPSPPVPDVVAQLEKLNELRIAGLLTDEEFCQQKERLLASM